MIGIIGLGNMGTPLLKGAVKVFGKENVTCFDVSESRKKEIGEELGIVVADTNIKLVESSDIILFAIKPQIYDTVINEIKETVINSTEKKTIISIAPGIATDYLLECFKNNVNVVRCMPNTPALVGEGMTAVCFPESFEGNKEAVLSLLQTIGTYVELPERLMNTATVASGSSPAYVYMFIEAMADGVVKYGIPRDMAYKMVAQTVLGSAKMVLETGLHPGALKDNVCSPGGTTICGVSALEEEGFRNSIIKACDAVYEKGNAFGKR